MDKIFEESTTYEVQQPDSGGEGSGLLFQSLDLDSDPVAGESVTATLSAEIQSGGAYKFEIEFQAGGESDVTKWKGDLPDHLAGTPYTFDGDFQIPEGATELVVTARAFSNVDLS